MFVIRLYEGEVLHEEIERLAAQEGIQRAYCVAVGGARGESRLIVGPRDAEESPVTPMTTLLEEVHEVAGVGTIFPGTEGTPVLHMHLAAGRERSTITGCIRKGVITWRVLEIVIQEITGSPATRKMDEGLGLALLAPNG